MITDEMLRQAAEEAALSINESLPAPEECHHNFSPEFEKKIRKLEKKVKHPVFYQVMKSAACFLLVVSIGFTSVVAFSPEARAAVFGWFRSVYESFYEYEFEGDPSGIEATEYSPQWIPDGYHFTKKYTVPYGREWWYENDAGNILLFSYSNANKDTSFSLGPGDDSEVITCSTASIHGNHADIYLSQNPSDGCVIVWTDSETGTLLCIYGILTEDELIQMAESVVTE